MVNDFVASVLRELAQKIVGLVAVWLAAHVLPVPSAVTDWAVLALVTGGVALWTVAVRFLETRVGDTPFGRLARFVARLLMLGINAKPSY